MNNVEKIITVIIQLQALAFFLQAISQWCLIAVEIISASLQAVPSKLTNYEALLEYSVIYLIISLILYFRSRSLARYFVSSFDNEKDLSSSD